MYLRNSVPTIRYLIDFIFFFIISKIRSKLFDLRFSHKDLDPQMQGVGV